jgi:hypothetical protein
MPKIEKVKRNLPVALKVKKPRPKKKSDRFLTITAYLLKPNQADMTLLPEKKRKLPLAVKIVSCRLPL